MIEFFKNGKRGLLFKYGKDDDISANICAKSCRFFMRDYEEECITEDEKSCYNCRYRRWTADSFECMNGNIRI